LEESKIQNKFDFQVENFQIGQNQIPNHEEEDNLDDELCLDEIEEHNTIVGEENPNISSFHLRLMAGVVPHLRVDVDNK
jgi:hypothetical protein